MHVCVHSHISGLMHASETKFLQLYQYERIEVLYRYYASTRKLVTAVSMGTGILTVGLRRGEVYTAVQI